MPIEKESVVKNYLNKFLSSTPIYSDLSGGINVRKNQIELNTNEFFYGKNIYLNSNMGIVGRGGIRKILPSVVPGDPNIEEINGLYQARFSKGDILIACRGYNVYAWNGSTWTNLTSGITRTSIPLDIYTFTFYNDYLIIADGANYPLKVSYNGTAFTVTEMTNAPKCNYVFSWYSFLVFAGDGTNKVYFSAANDIDTYPLENYLLVGGNKDNQPITAISSILGNIIVFKKNSTYTITGNTTDNLVVTQLNPNIGCIAENCVTNTRTDVYFLSHNGVWRITSGLSFEYLSEKILPRFQTLSKTYVNYNRPVIAYNSYKEQIWLSVDYNNDYYHDRVFVYDIIMNHAITEYYFYEGASENYNPKILAQYYYNGNTRLISVNRKDGYIRIHDSHFSEGVYGDDGKTVYAEYESKLFNLGDPNRLKSLRYYYIYGNVYGGSSIANDIIMAYYPQLNSKATSSITLHNPVRGATSHIYNNNLYVIGGYNGSVFQYIQKIDLSSGVKTLIAFPTGVSATAYHASVFYNNNIYIFGGWNGSSILNRIIKFNVITETFTVLTNTMNTAREWHTANLVGTKIYLIGGFNGSYLSSIEEFNTVSETCINKTSLTYAVSLHSSAVYNDKIYIFGGFPTTNNSQHVRYYDTTNDTITELGSIMPISVWEHGSIEFNVSGIDYAYLFCGYSSGDVFDSVYRFKFSDNTFSLVNNMPYGTYWFSICKDSNYIYIAGGQSIGENNITFKYTNDMVNFTSVSSTMVIGSRQVIPSVIGSIPYKFISIKISTPVNWNDLVINGYMLDYIIWQRRD